ncbi:MAG: hypothetical protein SPK70_08285 [Succinivibrio dextrinosolvens]|nr:hypothetical protein [Succinivibrio dextrinosolvens]
MRKSKQELLKKVIQTKYCTDKLIHSLKESLNEFIVEEHSEEDYDRLFEQIEYIAEELLPVLEKMRLIWTNRTVEKSEVITYETKQ